jgi:hypothetical protein
MRDPFSVSESLELCGSGELEDRVVAGPADQRPAVTGVLHGSEPLEQAEQLLEVAGALLRRRLVPRDADLDRSEPVVPDSQERRDEGVEREVALVAGALQGLEDLLRPRRGLGDQQVVAQEATQAS